MSALGQKRTSLFDHLIRAADQRVGNGETERLRGLEIDAQLDLSRLLHREVAGFSPFRMRAV